MRIVSRRPARIRAPWWQMAEKGEGDEASEALKMRLIVWWHAASEAGMHQPVSPTSTGRPVALCRLTTVAAVYRMCGLNDRYVVRVERMEWNGRRHRAVPTRHYTLHTHRWQRASDGPCQLS